MIAFPFAGSAFIHIVSVEIMEKLFEDIDRKDARNFFGLLGFHNFFSKSGFWKNRL